MEQEKTLTRSNCCHLRSKMAYIPIPEVGEDWRTTACSVGSYWCLCTMTPVGPDEYFVAPEVCQPNRRCYKETDLT